MLTSIDLPPPRESYAKQFLKSQFTKPIPPPKDMDLTSQTGIITGANSSLSLDFAHVALDHKLSGIILAVRSIDKGNDAASQLKKQHPSAQIEVWSLDMTSYDSIQAFAKRCATLDRIDFAVLNMGMYSPTFRILESTGHEKTFQVNYLSTALLAMLLLPILKEKHPKGKPVHLTTVGTGLVFQARFSNQDADPLIPSFDEPKGWSGSSSGAIERNSICKFMMKMFIVKLSNFVSADDVVVNIADPGFIWGTALNRSRSAFSQAFIRATALAGGRSVRTGAWAYIDAAVVKEKESHGSYLYSWKIFP